MDNNLWINTNEKPHNCKVCFSKKDILNNPFWTHPGEKPHICEVHNKEFSERNNSNKHLRTQITSKNPHVCKICKKDFS